MPSKTNVSPLRLLITLSQLSFFVLSCVLALTVHAETKRDKNAANEITQITGELSLDTLNNKIKSITDKQGLDEAIKNKIISHYQATKENLENTQWFKSQTLLFQDALKTAPFKVKALQTDIIHAETHLKDKTTEYFQNIPTDELEQRYIIEKGKLSEIDDALKKLESELVVQNSRPQLIRTETVTAKQALESAQQKFSTLLSEIQSHPEVEALQFSLKTLIEARTAELKMYDFEAISNPVRMQLLKLNLQLLNLKKQALQPTIENIEEELAIRREQEAHKMREEQSQVEKEIQNKHRIIQSITRENIQYSRDLQTVTLRLEQYTAQKNNVDNQASAIESNFKSAEKKINLAGLSPALGKLLREQRRNLVIKDEFLLKSEALQTETDFASLEQLKVEDRLKQIRDIDAELKRLMLEDVSPDLPNDQRLRIKAELRILLNNQKELLDKLAGIYVEYLRILGDVDFSRQQLQNQAKKYAAYLDKRLLWVPSSLPIGLDYPFKVYQSIRWLFSPSNGLLLTQNTLMTFLDHYFLGTLALLTLIILQQYKHQLKTLIGEINNKVSKPSTDKFGYTIQNLGLTLILVAPLALLFNYLGWFLSSNMQLANFTKAVGMGLKASAIPLFFLQFFYHLFSPEGIARKHFHWRKNTINLIRQQLKWAIYLVVPSVFIIHMTNAADNIGHSDSLGRLALIILMLTLSFILGTLLHPKNEILPRKVRENPNHWLTRFYLVWYCGIILVPLIIIGFAVSGYYQSALELQEKLVISMRMIFTAIIVHELVVRWLMVVNRQLASQNARQAELLAAENRPLTGSLPISSSEVSAHGENEQNLRIPPSQELLDIPAINAQTLQILNVTLALLLLIGGWVVWQDMVPAISILDQVQLWEYSTLIDGQEVSQAVTLTNLFFAGILLFIAVITIRNLTGLMEILVYRRFVFEAGSRYAINQLTKYFLITIAFITVANELGGSWSQVQWLAAALSVGLGFGLQEIFANFVSGIILLFERPIRVGDTVTVGDITGTVNQIQMRATTLIDNDQKELIVPNKTFITSQLINWTLTNPITRVVIPISIAYGSDIELAHRLMLETITSIPEVLETPEPSALFVGFGESSLDFSVRIYVGILPERLQVTHQFHIRLEKAFREHNIIIPFPQREIHIRTGSPEENILKTN